MTSHDPAPTLLTAQQKQQQQQTKKDCCWICRKCPTPDTKLLRCGRCRGPERYCSRTCQRVDWRQRHGPHCRARAAWNELQDLVQQTTVPQATQAYHQATDQVHELQQTETKTKTKRTAANDRQPETKSNRNEHSVESTFQNKSSEETQHQIATASATNKQQPQSPQQTVASAGEQSVEIDSIVSSFAPLAKTIEPDFTDWHMHVTNLNRLSCFQIDLQAVRHLQSTHQNDENDWTAFSCRPVSPQPPKGDHAGVHPTTRVGLFQQYSHQSSQLEKLVLVWDLPLLLPLTQASVTTTLGDQDSCCSWTIRLGYSKAPPPLLEPPQFPLDLKDIVCRACHLELGRNNAPSVFLGETSEAPLPHFYRLPTGHWTGMAEYLSCGQEMDAIWNTNIATTKNVASSSDEPARVGWNNGHWVGAVPFDETAVAELPPTQFLHESNWIPSILSAPLTSANPLVCQYCYSVLGWRSEEREDNDNDVANPKNVYWLRHLLACRPQGRAFSSPLIFWIHELLHVAETQAVYTLVLHRRNRNHNKNEGGTSLWIQLWQWDSVQASGDGATRNMENNHDSLDLKWHRIAKVVYRNQFVPNTVNDNDQNEKPNIPLAWTLGGDWCCPPGTDASSKHPVGTLPNPFAKEEEEEEETTKRFLEARVDDWEYESIERDLKESHNLMSVYENSPSLQSRQKAVVQATFWAQTGDTLTDEQRDQRNAGIAHVPLD